MSDETARCPECLKPCEIHGILYCETCHYHPGECHYGGCVSIATHTLTHESGREKRRFCTKHATHPHYGFARAGYTIKADNDPQN